jgi:alpha-L-fucosidase
MTARHQHAERALAALTGLFLTVAANGQTGLNAGAEPSEQQQVDGSAEAYAGAAMDKAVVPDIEERDGRKYYTWPMWNESKNRKMQVLRERTTHPDAQWWPHAGLGLFMHWGIISEFGPSGEAWSGRWTQAREDKGVFHPQEQLWKAAETFNPVHYDPEKWMAGASRAGFKYAVLTTKHHDGYALWDSDWALMGVRQYLDGRDLIAPYVQACRNNGVKVGFYYSGMDWYFDRDYMNFAVGSDDLVNFRGEHVTSLPKRPPARWEAYQQYNEKQVEELITKYHPDIWWGDGGHGATIEKIRELRPGIVCSNRGAGSGDHATPEGYHMAEPRFIRPVVENGWWWELCTIIQGGSGWDLSG